MLPSPLIYRTEPGQLLSQDLLSGIEAFACSTLSPDTAARTWGAREDAEAHRTPAQLAALGCGYALDYPWQHPERVRGFDHVDRRIVSLVPAVVARSLTQTVEICRVPLDRFALGVLERIATYVYAAPIVGGVPVHANGAIIGGPIGQTLHDPTPGAPPDLTSDPSPFPMQPVGINGTSQAGLAIRFHLINYPISQSVRDEPPLFTGREEDIPPVHVLPPWADQRYQWGALYGQGHEFVAGGRSLLRLFARVRIWGTTETLQGTYLRFVSRLAGFTQNAGPWRAAQESALRRSW